MAWQELCDLQWSTAAQDEMTSASFTALLVSSRRCCRETKSTVRYCWQEDYPWCVHCPRPGQKQIQSPVNNIKAATVCRCVQMWRYQNERYSQLQEANCRTRALTHEDVNGAQDCVFFEGIIKVVILRISVRWFVVVCQFGLVTLMVTTVTARAV